jgi:ankyrin repeat protein
MLLIPDGDFVTGEMREESYLYRMPFNEYVHIFWQSFETKEQRLNRENTDTYVRDYNSMFLKSINKEKLKKVESKAKSLALDSLNEENLDDFRTIIDRYKLISTKYEDGDNLLHLASKYDKKVIARYLLAKGINQFDLNKNKQTAYYIANLLQNFDIVRLLLNARITKHLYY